MPKAQAGGAELMVKKWLRDISFQKKMSLIFTVVCAFSTSVGGILYYQFAQREIVTNYKANAESLAAGSEPQGFCRADRHVFHPAPERLHERAGPEKRSHFER